MKKIICNIILVLISCKVLAQPVEPPYICVIAPIGATCLVDAKNGYKINRQEAFECLYTNPDMPFFLKIDSIGKTRFNFFSLIDILKQKPDTTAFAVFTIFDKKDTMTVLIESFSSYSLIAIDSIYPKQQIHLILPRFYYEKKTNKNLFPQIICNYYPYDAWSDDITSSYKKAIEEQIYHKKERVIHKKQDNIKVNESLPPLNEPANSPNNKKSDRRHKCFLWRKLN